MTIALLLTGVKYALVLFFIVYAVGAYAARQEYRTFVLSRVAPSVLLIQKRRQHA